MASDERAIVLGEQPGPSVPTRPPEPSRSALRWLLPVLGVLAIVLVSVWPRSEAADPGTGVDGLAAPEEPEIADIADPPVQRVVVESLDARALYLAGTGGVEALDHGAAGWLAVSSGRSVVAHVSRDGATWLSSTVHGLAGVQPVAAVGDRLMAVVGSSGGPASNAPPAIGAVSPDGGDSWNLVEHAGPISVRDVGVMDDQVFVVGSAGEVATAEWEPGYSATAGLWKVGDGVLEPIPLSAAGAGSEARAFSSDVGLVFGTADGRPAAWALTGERVPLEFPPGPAQRFVTVESTPSGLVAAVGRLGDEGGSELWESADGTVWERISVQAGTNAIVDVAVGPGGDLEITTADDLIVWRQDSGLIDLDVPDGLLSVANVETSDRALVWSGATSRGPVLLVSGIDGWPMEVVALPSGDPAWRTDARIRAGRPTTLLGTVSVGDRSFVVGSAGIYEILGSGAGTDIVTSVDAPEVDPTRAPQLLLESFNGSPVQDYPGAGGWTGRSRPLDEVLGVGMVDVASSRGEDPSIVVVARNEAGGWLLTDELPLRYHVVVPIDGGYVGQRIIEGEPDGSAVFSSDRENWRSIGDWTLELTLGSDPVLRSVGSPTVFAILDRFPNLIPLIDAYGLQEGAQVLRTGADVLIVEGEAVRTRRSGGRMDTVIPTDLEHGITGRFSVVPGSEPRIVMIDDGGLSVLSWR